MRCIPIAGTRMSEPIMRDENNQALAQLEVLLKRSDYLNDIMQTHRVATERVLLCLIEEMVDGNPERMQGVIRALKKAEKRSRHPSVDSEVRRLALGIKTGIQNPT